MTERKADGSWGAAQRLATPVNTDVHEFCPVVVADGTLYFVSARPGGIRGTEPTEVYNVWRARALDKTGLRFGEPQNLGKAINTGLETNVYVSPDDVQACLRVAKETGYDAWVGGTVHEDGNRKAVDIESLGITFDAESLKVR